MVDKFVLILPGIVGVMYFVTGLLYLFKKDYAWACVWLAYAIANVGLIIASIPKE